MAGNADAARGAGAMIGTARVMATLFSMSEKEAEDNGIAPEDRLSYLRYDDAKSNHAKMTADARWFQKKGIPLPQGPQEYPDEAPVLIPCQLGGTFANLSVSALNTCLDAIAKGPVDETGKSLGLFSDANKATHKVFGVVKDVLKVSDKRAQNIVKAWKESGLLLDAEYRSPDRKDRTGLKVDNSKRPGGKTEAVLSERFAP